MELDVDDTEVTEVPLVRQRKSKTLARLKKLKAQRAHEQAEIENISSNKSPRLENLGGTPGEDSKDTHDAVYLGSEGAIRSPTTTHQSYLLKANESSHLGSNNQSSQNWPAAKPPWHEEEPRKPKSSTSTDVVVTRSSFSENVSLDVESLTSDHPGQSSVTGDETGQKAQPESQEVLDGVGQGSIPGNSSSGCVTADGIVNDQSSEDGDRGAIPGHRQQDEPTLLQEKVVGLRCEILEDIKERDEEMSDSDDDLLCIGRSSSSGPASTNSFDALQHRSVSNTEEVKKEVSEDEAIGSASSDDGIQPLDQSGSVLGGAEISTLEEAGISAGNVTSKNQPVAERNESTEMEISSSGGLPSDMSIPGNSALFSDPSTSRTGSDLVQRTYSEPPLGSRTSLSETNRLIMSTGALLPISTQSARRNQKRSYLSGGLRNTGSLLGKEELERNLPDRKIRVFVSTWNMHEEKDLPDNLEDLVLPEESAILQDIYVIGTQESTPDVNEWAIRTQETLGTTHILLHKASLGVLHLLIFIRRDLYWFCSAVEEDSIATRPGSMIKTKGAVAVSFTFFGTSLLFIVSHFTSGDENISNRVQDYNKIIRTLDLPIKVPPTRKYNVDKDDITTRFDAVFWCGDFNFRLMESRAKVENWATQLREGNISDYNILLQHDQLRKSMQKNSIFKGFQEGEINFLPTYKYDPGEDVYDTSSKARIPSYTDRVLFKPRRAGEIGVLFYNSCGTIKCSDHRPVYGIYEVKVRPGRDDILCGTPSFAKEVFVEANRRRAAGERSSDKSRSGNSQKSAICSVM